MRIAVSGTRYATTRHLETIGKALDGLHAIIPITVLIHGNATGVDQLADIWARLKGIEVEQYDANWKAHGRGAGPQRNRLMLTRADGWIAFPMGKSPGTRNFISQAQKMGIAGLINELPDCK